MLIHHNNVQPLQHVAIPIEPDTAPPAPQESAHPHPADVIQNRRPGWINRMTEGARTRGAQVAGGVANTVRSLRDDPKPLLYAAAAEALLLVAKLTVSGGNNPHMAHSHGRQLGATPVVVSSSGAGARAGANGDGIYGSSPDSSSDNKTFIGMMAAVGGLSALIVLGMVLTKKYCGFGQAQGSGQAQANRQAQGSNA